MFKVCAKHEAVPVEVIDAAYPFPVFRDECKHCGSIMVPDWNNTENGVTPMKALPMAKVISLCEYRKARELEKAALQSVANFGPHKGE